MYQSLSSQLYKLSSEPQIYRMANIGSGKFGTVYQGYDKTNGRMVALKFITNNKQESWKKEIQILQMFDHPNIIKYYGCIPQKINNGQNISGIYIVTQFIRGKTLQQYIASAAKVGEKGLSEQLVFKLFRQLLNGYSYIHDKNFVHRDIKPQNILIDENQNVKIIDFGQSKQRKLLRTKGLGTPLYSAPETFADKNPADFRRDVWSLGLVLYEMITGTNYFQSWKECVDQNQFRKFLQSHKIKVKLPKNFSPIWTQIVKNMLQKDYNKRKNLHQFIFQFKKQENKLQKKLNLNKINHPSFLMTKSAVSGNTNPLTQSQNQFQFSRTKKYLRFFNQKHKFPILLTNLLTKYNYPFLSNAHKLIVVFMSFAIYISSIDHLLKRLQKNRIKINENQIFDLDHFQQPYQSKMKEQLEVYRQYYVRQSRLTKDLLLQKIIPKFSPSQEKSSSSESGSFGSKQAIKVSIKASELIQVYPEIKALVQNFKEGINLSKSHYIQKFKQLIFSQNFYQNQQSIRKFFYQEDLTIYYLMLIISNLDDILNWKYEYLGNQIPKLREQLLNTNRQQSQIQWLISKILKYNNKNF